MDVWAGALAAMIYGVGTLSHPAYEPINTYLVGKPMPFMTPLGARSIVVIFLTAMYTVRVASTHYIPKRVRKGTGAPPQKLGSASSQSRAIKPLPKDKKGQ